MWPIIGHQRAVELLSRALEQDQLSHAYLFVGRAHVGKMTLARTLAQALNCEGQDRPCGQCRACQRVASGAHADVQVIGRGARGEGAAKEIGIDQVRELQHQAHLRPFEGRCRVFIVDGADHLSLEAANCLLKTLEEPPAGVFFVLLAADERRLLPTVLSRCQRLELFPVPPAIIERALVQDKGVPAEQARTLAHIAQGAIGWAYSAAEDPALPERRAKWLEELVDLGAAGLEPRFACAARLASEFANDRERVQETLGLWLGWWRDLLLVKGGQHEMVTNLDRADSLGQEAGGYSLSQIAGFVRALERTSQQVEENANPRLAFEVLMLDIPAKIEVEAS